MIALTQGRGILLRKVEKETERRRDDVFGIDHRSDFIRVISAWNYAKRARFSIEVCRELGIHAQAARQAEKLTDQFLAIARKRGLSTEVDLVEGDELGKCHLSGFSDQLARRMDKGTLRCDIVHGRRGNLARNSAVQKSTLLVVTEISEIEGKKGEVSTVLSMCSEVEESWLREFFPEEFKEESITSLDSSGKRVVERRRRLFRDLVLEDKVSEEVSDDAAAEILAEEIVSGRCKLLAWDEAVEQWICRVNCFSGLFPEFEISAIAEDERRFLLEQVCLGARSFKEVKRLDVWPTLKSWFEPEQAAAMEELLPERYVLPCGRKAKIRYLENKTAIVSARIQELYDVEGILSIAAGKLILKIEILAPNQRPIQVTDDLGSFWRKTYPEIKPALAGRYPKHEWR
jgi:ATP-dependent helicase HrpB